MRTRSISFAPHVAARWVMTLATCLCILLPTLGAAQAVAHISIQEVQRFLGKPGVFIYDVNLPEIWTANHLPGAIHIPDANLRRYLPHDRNAILIFYCAAPRCGASDSAAAEAAKLGYSRVYVMPEGIFGWVKAGLPIEKSDSSGK